MKTRLVWLKVISRVCALLVLVVAVVYLWTGPRVRGDSNTTCVQCDQNNVNGLSDCYATLNSCNSACETQYQACLNAGGGSNCDNGRDYCLQNCSTNHSNCQQSTWTNYDNCLYGFTDFSGLCSISTAQNPNAGPWPCQHRTPCDNDCRDMMFDCRANGGESCGQDYNDCKLSCCP
jgi:hypothetical protein